MTNTSIRQGQPIPVNDGEQQEPAHWLTRAATRFRLHLVLFAGFTVISAVPVVMLATWVERSAVEKEIAAVSEKHLLLAKNLTSALSRYVKDVKVGFQVAVGAAAADQTVAGMPDLLDSLNFRLVAIVDRQGQVLRVVKAPAERGTPGALLSDSISGLWAQAISAEGAITFSDILRDDNDQPAFAVFRRLSENALAVGVLAPDYLIEVQRSIAFGERGHSMIVDATGRVVAHPKAEWQRTSKDASKLSVVAAMMRGETGVAQFYSPPMQADMIAGHTTVPEVGWGVMVPQPMSELLDRAKDVQLIALAITVLGILLAGLISWWLAKFIARPIETEISERKRAERAVRSLNETLEQRVIERTAELREAQEELLKKQRLAVMGQTIGTVGHELRNPLAAVRNSLFMIGDLGREADVDLSRPLSRVERSVKRCENIIAELLDYTRIGDLELEPTAFDNWLDEVLRDQPTPAGIAVEYDLQAGGIELPLDDDRFRRVLINLHDNACQAMDQNNAQDACLAIRTAVVGDALEIRFCDTGPGMTRDVLDQIFEPLFTTKTTGVGLGLPAVRQIVEQHGGTIEFVSAVGEGTTALVRLPLRHQVEAAA